MRPKIFRASLLVIAVAAIVTAAPSVAKTTPVKCALPQACALFTNTSSGPALEGVSSTGAGLLGTSASGLYDFAGVDGESSNASGLDAGGVFGVDYLVTGTAPTYGAVTYGTGQALVALGVSPGTSSAFSYGVLGEDAEGKASMTTGDYNVGVVGQSIAGTGILGESNASPTISIFGGAPVGVYGVASTATTPNGNAFDFFGETNSFGLDIHNLASNTVDYVNAPGILFEGSGPSGSFSVSTSGNEFLSGTLTTSKGTYVRTTGASGSAVMEYSQRTTAPEVEDVGEGQLANGRAYVSIDARLADTIDRRTPYHVFVTPEGDCNGLFVTQKSAAGFAVHELRGGRSTLSFEFRIVAKPLDENGARLATAPTLVKPLDDGMRTGRSARRAPPAPLLPQERLKRQLGTQAYAREMLDLRAQRQL